MLGYENIYCVKKEMQEAGVERVSTAKFRIRVPSQMEKWDFDCLGWNLPFQG